MERPNSHAAPARRRITPVAVKSHEQTGSALIANEQPLRIGPAPSKGSTKDISQCGRGRRIWVDIQNDITIKFKDVLRQQGLDHATWRKGLEQSRAHLEGAPQGADARRQGFTGRLYQRVQGLYEASDDTDSSGQDASLDGAGSDPAANGRGGEDAAGSDGDDEDDDDDDEEDKEGEETGAEIDIANELNKPKRRRQRFERYDDDFIDDSELIMVKGEAKELKTKFMGFYSVQGDVELQDQPDKTSKPRSKPKPRAPKAPAAAAAAKPGETAAAAAQPSKAASGKRRHESEQQPPPLPGALPPPPAAAAGEAPKRKKQRSEPPAAAAATGAPRTDVVEGSTAPASAAAHAAPAPAPAPASLKAAAAAGGGDDAVDDGGGSSVQGTAGKAMAAALAARAKKGTPTQTETDNQTGPAGAAGKSAQAAAPPPTAATAQGSTKHIEIMQQQAAAAGQVSGTTEQHKHKQQAAVDPHYSSKAPNIAEAAAAAAVSNAGGVQDAAAAALAAGLPSALVSAVRDLQQKVAEHKPSVGVSNAMSKPVKHALQAVGFTYLLLPAEEQQQHQDALLQVVMPLMLPYGKERKVRKEVFEGPQGQLADIDNKVNELMKQLEAVRTGAAAAEGAACHITSDDDDFQSPHWPPAAESALVAAWKAAEKQPVGDRLQQLAVTVMTQLGRYQQQQQQQPEKAYKQLEQLYHRAKKKAKKEKKATDSQGTAAAAAASGGTPQPSTAAAALQQQPSASSIDTVPSARGQSPEPSAAAAAAGVMASDAVGRSTVPKPSPLRTRSLAAIMSGLEASAAADDTAAVAAAAAAACDDDVASIQVKKEQEKLSMPSAASPRLQGCLTAAQAAGAPPDWLEQSCPKSSSAVLAQIFRVLCHAGPQGCTAKNMPAAAAGYGLGFSWEDSPAQRSSINQSVHTQLGRNIIGLTASDPPAYALCCFEGVRPQPQKPPKQPKSAADAAAELAAGAAGGGGGEVEHQRAD